MFCAFGRSKGFKHVAAISGIFSLLVAPAILNLLTIEASGLPKDLAQASIRFSLGRFSRTEDIQQAIDYLKNRLL